MGKLVRHKSEVNHKEVSQEGTAMVYSINAVDFITEEVRRLEVVSDGQREGASKGV